MAVLNNEIKGVRMEDKEESDTKQKVLNLIDAKENLEKNYFENNYKQLTNCPYCEAKVVKRGLRKKKYEIMQIQDKS